MGRDFVMPTDNPLRAPVRSRVFVARTHKLWLLLFVLGTATWGAARADAPSDVEQIRGFTVDFHLASRKQRETVRPSLIHQLEIVESVPEPALAFFRTVPIVIDPSITGVNGMYRQIEGRWVVAVRPASLPAERAIVLHELLHAYHVNVLKLPTPAVGRALTQALRPGTYPASYEKAYFLTNGREYFAVVAEVYLFGKTERPPFICSNVLKAQPEFIEYLAGLFGKRECK
jgi:hypothetical protein